MRSAKPTCVKVDRRHGASIESLLPDFDLPALRE
jgi:hypothetical protein